MWRETATNPRLFILDARALFPLGIFLLHISKATFYIALIGVLIFTFLMRLKIGPYTMFLILRCWLMGRDRVRTDDVIYRRRSRGLK